MANIQHRDIAESQLHEPKGVSIAPTGSVYTADGLGSGLWRKQGSDTLMGLAGDSGVSGKKLLSNGANGFSFVADSAYGTAYIDTNTTSFTTVAAADATLKTVSQFQLLTGTGAPWFSQNLFNTTFTTDRLTASVGGLYRVDLSMSIKAFPSSSAKLAAKFCVNSAVFSTRNQIAKSNAAGDEEQLSGFVTVSLNANDYVQVYIACSASGSLLIHDADFTLTLIKAT